MGAQLGPEIDMTSGLRYCNRCKNLEPVDGKPVCKELRGKTGYKYQIVIVDGMCGTPRTCPYYR